MKRAIPAIVILAIACYVVDFAAIRLRQQPFGTVQVQSLLAIPLKNGKTEFIAGDSQPEKCAQSLFPQMGCAPCWYLNRNKKKRVDM